MGEDSELDADLADYLLTGDGWPGDDDEEWQPSDEGQVDHLLRVLALREAEIARLRTYYQARVLELDAWLDDRTAGMVRSVESLRRALEGWSRQMHPGESGHVWTLPSGVLRLTGGRESLVVEEEAVAVAWLVDNLREAVVMTVSRTALKAVVKAGPERVSTDGKHHYAAVTPDGEVVPGVRIEKPANPSFGASARR